MSTPFTEEQVRLLKADLDESKVKQREQSGRKFSYLEGFHVIGEANAIFGFGDWSRETVHVDLIQQETKTNREGKEQSYVGYIARVRISTHGVIRDGVGFGQGIDSDLGRAHESAIKEAETDAMKRALVTFGNPFGLSLYDKTPKSKAPSKPHAKAASAFTEEQKAEAKEYLESIGFTEGAAWGRRLHAKKLSLTKLALSGKLNGWNLQQFTEVLQRATANDPNGS